MTKRILFIIYCSFVVSHVVAQRYYLNALLDRVSTAEQATYIVEKTDSNNTYYAKLYYLNEQLASEGFYADSSLKYKHGLHRHYYNDGKSLFSQVQYSYNIPHGIWKSYYKNGSMRDSGRLYYNYRVKLWKFWYPNGQLKQEGKYADSFYTPSSITGNISTKNKPKEIAAYLEQFYDQTKVGKWTSYHDNGKKKSYIHFNESEAIGFSQSWYANGILESEGIYKNGKYDSIWTWYHPNGKVATVETYIKNKLHKLTCYEPNGKEKKDLCYVSTNGLLSDSTKPISQFFYKKSDYPAEAQFLKMNVSASVNATINENGEIIAIDYETPLPHKSFEKLIENKIRSFRYKKAAIKHNRVMESSFSFNFYFLYY